MFSSSIMAMSFIFSKAGYRKV